MRSASPGLRMTVGNDSIMFVNSWPGQSGRCTGNQNQPREASRKEIGTPYWRRRVKSAGDRKGNNCDGCSSSSPAYFTPERRVGEPGLQGRPGPPCRPRAPTRRSVGISSGMWSIGLGAVQSGSLRQSGSQNETPEVRPPVYPRCFPELPTRAPAMKPRAYASSFSRGIINSKSI
jgi:hypothetical protein